MTRNQYRLLALSALMATTLAAGPVLAEDGPRGSEDGRPHHEGRGGPDGPGKMFKESDVNGDGFLTREEMENAHQKRLDQMFKDTDTDNDGKLSQDEMKAGREKMREKMRERMKERKERHDDRHDDDGDKPDDKN